MLPQVIVLLAAGPFVNRFVENVGFLRAAWLSAASVVTGLAVYAVLGRDSYIWVAVALALVAAGIRVSGLVAGMNVLHGLPGNRTSIGTALVDTASEVSTGIGIAVAGTILAAVFTGNIATANWTAHQTIEFQQAATIAGLTLTGVAAVLVGWGIVRARISAAEGTSPAPAPADG
jgi:hypothetical protein